jgi:PA14 domain
MTAMQRRQPRRPRHAYYFLGSLALHAALFGLVSLRSCGRDPPPVVPALSHRPVTVEVADFSPPPRPRTARPGGGAAPGPSLRHLPARQVATVAPRVVALSPEEPHGREAAVATTEDAVAAPSRAVVAPPAGAGPPGTGPGSRGGPGGRGAGAGGGGPPLVSGTFAFGGATRGRFKGIACFIPRGVLRIADVHGCAPAAVFYTNTFDVPERQQGEGFPGITTRSSWFMIEYTGVFTVGKDGSYEFRLHSDDGSYLFIDGAMVIENDGKHQPTSRRGSIRLRTGEHQLKLLYAQTTDRMALQLFVRVPGSDDEKLFTPRL